MLDEHSNLLSRGWKAVKLHFTAEHCANVHQVSGQCIAGRWIWFFKSNFVSEKVSGRERLPEEAFPLQQCCITHLVCSAWWRPEATVNNKFKSFLTHNYDPPGHCTSTLNSLVQPPEPAAVTRGFPPDKILCPELEPNSPGELAADGIP